MSLPQPARSLQTESAGWWKAPSSLGTDPSFLRVPDETRLAAIALHVCSIGWCQNHESRDGWIPAAAVQHGQVIAAPREALLAAVEGLVTAGLWIAAVKDELDGYVIAGAATSVEQRYKRQADARKAGETSAANRQTGAGSPSQGKGFKRFDLPPVDWSKESGEL